MRLWTERRCCSVRPKRNDERAGKIFPGAPVLARVLSSDPMKALAILICAILAGCATGAPRAVSAPRDLSGTKLEFTDLHSSNTYQFLAGGRYRSTALSQNGLHTDRREGTFAAKRTGQKARIVFDNDEVMRLVFVDADSGTCQFDGDVRTYRFRLVSSETSDSPN